MNKNSNDTRAFVITKAIVMCRLKIFIQFSCFAIIFRQFAKTQKKPCDTVVQYVNGTKIIWPLGTSSVSVPPCLAENFEIIRRKCKDGVWEPEPYCAHLLDSAVPKCPENFSVYGDDFCYIVLRPGPFHERCPYPDELQFSELESKLSAITNDAVWYPVERNDEDGFGEYYFIEKSELYGTRFTNEMESVTSIVNNHCVVRDHNKTYRLVNCDDTYQKVCMYKILTNARSRLCHINFPLKFCTQIFSGDTINCVCLTTGDSIGRNEFCDKLVELPQRYQNQIHMISKDEMCWIGLEKKNSKYVWSNTQKDIDYALWTKDASFSSNYVTISKDGWFPRSDGSKVSCAFCAETIDYEIPSLSLEYNKNNNSFILKATFYVHLKATEDNTSFYCFMHAGTNDMQARVYTVSNKETEVNNYDQFFEPLEDGPGYYWCEGFYYPNLEKIKSNEVFFYDKSLFGDEYVIKINVSYDKGTDPFSRSFFYDLRNNLLKNLDDNFVKNIRKFKTLRLDENILSVQLLIHLTTNAYYLNSRENNYYALKKAIDFAVTAYNGTLDDFSSSNFCPNETVPFISSSIIWPITPLGDTAFPEELCMQNNGNFVKRHCEGDFVYGAHWAPSKGTCDFTVPKSVATEDLQSLLDDDLPTEVIVQNLVNITESFEDFNYTDIFLVGQILHKVSDDDEIFVEDITSVVSNIIDTDRNILIDSQYNLNATDSILQMYDKILNTYNLPRNESYKLISTRNVIVLLADLTLTNIIGLALFVKGNAFHVELVNTDTDIENILTKNNLEAAIFVNHKLLEQIREDFDSKKQLTITIFFEDSLFNEDEIGEKFIDNSIIGVLLPELHKKFEAPISVFFKPHSSNNFEKLCSHWQFSSDDYAKSHWLESGEIHTQSDIVNCEFWHATHFGLLVINDKNVLGDAISFELLSIISTINCVISLTGLTLIFATSLLFKTWRLNTSNQVLINFALAISLQIVALYWSSAVYTSKVNNYMCIILGALLHYSVISEFCWMLVLGVLQFKRLVVVYGGHQKYILIKACIVGWGLPLIPVMSLIIVSHKNYLNDSGVCYPTGLGLVLSVLLPISLILFINISIFTIIMYNICKKGPECSGNTTHDLLFQWRMMVLLFFLLGLTWLFGLFSYLDGGIIFLYVFCFLATLQGFMLFLFFIVFSKATRRLYVNLLKKHGIYYIIK